jgi:serine/threonine protein kinase
MKNGGLRKYSGIQKNKIILEIFNQIVEGIKVVHDHGLIHSDIKGQNIMIKESGNQKDKFEIKIIDLGGGV